MKALYAIDAHTITTTIAIDFINLCLYKNQEHRYKKENHKMLQFGQQFPYPS